MAVTKYNVYNFDETKALQGALVAMVSVDATDGDEVSTATTGGITLKGVGICRHTGSSFILVIESIEYTFAYGGKAISDNANGFKLMLAVTQDKASEVGTVVQTDGTTAITRGVDGSVTYSEEDGQSVVVNTLEPRDQFAINALKTLMERMEKDPSTISDNEMSFLCENAYQWAANMMTQASKVRATVTTEDSGSGGGVEVDESELSDTTDKLLNNIVAALEKTDKEITEDGKQVKAERLTIPEFNKFLDTYISHTETPEGGGEPVTKKYGLYDLIQAIKDIDAGGGGGGTTTVDFTPLINAINAKQVAGEITTQIGNTGLGRDADHPIYINGGGFPSRQVLASAFTEAIIHDFLTFNEAGAVGYSTKEEVKKAILGYLNAYADLTALSSAIYTNLSDTIDNRIKAWLEAAKDAENRPLTVNTPT